MVTMSNRDRHYIVVPHESKHCWNPYCHTAYVGQVLDFNDISVGISAYSTIPTAYVCDYLSPTNYISLHRNSTCRENFTIWVYKSMFYRISAVAKPKLLK